MDKRQQTCCFTGHRILPRGIEDELWTKTYAHLQPLLTQGVRYFGAPLSKLSKPMDS